MKTYLSHGLAFAAIMAAFSFAGAGAAFADDHHDAWSHDHNGYWDDHGARHAFVMHENHHGYWRDNNGVRVFINID